MPLVFLWPLAAGALGFGVGVVTTKTINTGLTVIVIGGVAYFVYKKVVAK